jgi:hypothetical protein
VLTFLRDDGLVVLSIVAAVAVLAFLVYAIINRRKPRPKDLNAKERVDQEGLGEAPPPAEISE